MLPTQCRCPGVLALGTLLSLASLVGLPGAWAEERPLQLRVQSLIFADNTEFFGPFRTGETVAGAWVRASVQWPLSDRARFDVGVMGREAFGSEKAVEETRPLVALRLGTDASHVILGTLDPGVAMGNLGPDRHSPHGLLPPLHGETLSFERPWEAGFAWAGATDDRAHDVWISWQRLNTEAHRERLNAGVSIEKRFGRVAGFGQAHVVHEGGQLHAAGAVSDSAAFAAGADVEVWRHATTRLSVLGSLLVSAFEPDRAKAGDEIRGHGVFLRATYLRSKWRGHAAYWRGWDFVKVEGDANYGVIQRDGTRFKGAREYLEAGVAREFRPAPSVRVEVSARVHAYAGQIDYSYRVLAAVDAVRRLGRSAGVKGQP